MRELGTPEGERASMIVAVIVFLVIVAIVIVGAILLLGVGGSSAGESGG